MLPKINQNLYITIASRGEEGANEEYRTRVADMTDDTIFIEIPIHVTTGLSKFLHFGTELTAYFIDDAEIKNCFNSKVVGFADDVVDLYRITKPDAASITKMQRRNYVRVPAELEVAVKYSDQLQFVSLTDDVGGGGISLLCDEYIPLSAHDEVSCWLLLHYKNGQIEHVTFKSEIVRVLQKKTSGMQRVTMRFTDISDRDRQSIVRFCFERQFENRKN